MVVAEYLRDCGYKVVEGVNAEDVLAVLNAGKKIDVILADGSINGFELARQILQNHPDIDVILTNGVSRVAGKASDLCDDGPLEKPYHPPNGAEDLCEPKLLSVDNEALSGPILERSNMVCVSVHMACSEHPSEECTATRRQAVLVVEDEILVRFTVADYLRGAGYVVVEAVDAAEALGVFASGEPVDVVFTDVQMPGPMDGLMLMRWVQEHHPGVHVLVTSGKGDAALSSGLIADGAFFSKPYALEEVASRIHSLLEDCRA
jgi:CheY-like chemotaxis protein